MFMQGFGGKTRREVPLAIPKLVWEDNTKMNLKQQDGKKMD